ncbi:MAG: hypothetical protein K4571_10660 [Deltaproteobacteria bacterium]
MKNQDVEKDRYVFLDQYKILFQNKMHTDALSLAEDRLKVLPKDPDDLIATGLMDKARDLLCEVEMMISGMSLVLTRMGKMYTKKGYEKDALFCYQKLNAFQQTCAYNREVTPQRMSMAEARNRAMQPEQHDAIPLPDLLIKTLSGWLDEIQRIKTYVTHAE